MKMPLAMGILMMGAVCQAGGVVRATLETSGSWTGMLVMHITNVSSSTLRFLDIREGSAWCGEFYEVTAEKDGERCGSNGKCLYAPADTPRKVELAPGKTYDRDISPAAYVRSEKYLVPPCSITVTYRLSDRFKAQWREMAPDVDVDLTFQTDKMEMGAPDNRPAGNGQEPERVQQLRARQGMGMPPHRRQQSRRRPTQQHRHGGAIGSV